MESVWQMELIRPKQQEKLPPCRENCPSGTDIRGWIAIISQQQRIGLDREQAFTKAWERLVECTPLPSTVGRVCPHTCQTACNRNDKDSAVSIQAMERFIGDWAIEQGLALPRLQEAAEKRESVGVIGAGPAGLSFAYQMARRGYPVTIYEAFPQPGGMLRYGIPEYRLPRAVLDSEIQRILDLGVELICDVKIGREISVEELRSRHHAVFTGIGALQARKIGVAGEDGPGVLSGINFMYRVNSGHTIDLGEKVVVIGGGNTAIDAARAARRLGAEVKLLYRRTRLEMPAIDQEIDDAQEEGVDILFLSAPCAILREGERVVGVRVQKMRLSDADASGRRQPVAMENGETYDLAVDTVISAVSQQPDLGNLQDINPRGGRLETDGHGFIREGLWAGGDVLGLGTVTRAIGHGRRAAETLHGELSGTPAPHSPMTPVRSGDMHLEYYSDTPANEPEIRPKEEWLSKPNEEITYTISERQFLDEASRCLSCGSCYGCRNCWMFCNPSAYAPQDSGGPGSYFSFDKAACEGCGKCVDLCPCGYLSREVTTG